MLAEKRRSVIEPLEIEPLIEVRDRRGVNRLESDRDFQPSPDQSSELHRFRADQVGMRFDGDGSEGTRELGNRGHVLGWHGAVIEEVARVVELQPVRDGAGEFLQRALELRRQCSWRSRAIERPTPQIAE